MSLLKIKAEADQILLQRYKVDNNLDNGQIVKMIVTGRNQVGLTGNIVV
jgi:hypothetical protein